MKTRRQGPPGRGGGDKTRPGDGGGKPGSPRDRTARRSGKAPTRPSKSGRTKGSPGGAPAEKKGGRPRDGGERGKPRVQAPPPILARAGRELLYGRNAVREALRGRRDVERLFVAEGAREDERLRELLRLASERGATVDTIPRLMLDDATRGANHQGVALEAEAYRYASFDDLLDVPGTILVLDHLQDPQNVGTLLRAAEAAGVAGVVIPQNRAAEVTPAVVNASAGAVEHLRIATVPNLPRAIEALKGSGRWIAGLDSGPGSVDIYTAEIPSPTVLVLGAEGSGLGSLLKKHCDLLLSLPMHGRVESLNASTAGSIALYELLRRAAVPDDTPADVN